MRSFLSCLVLIAALAGPSFAAEPVEAVPTEPAAAGQSRIDELLSELKRERREKPAERIAARIGEQWLKSGSSSIDLLMQWSDTAIKAKNFAAALDFLDRVIVLEPGFAEGWNQRATVHFLMNNHRKAMLDIDQTLRLEPRHFGALAGMGRILRASGQKQQALFAFERVLEVYPMLRSAQSEYAALAEELADRGT